MFFVELPVQRESVMWPNDYENAYEEWILAEARSIAQKRLQRFALVNLPSEASELLIDRLASYETEVFGCLFLDTQLRVQAFEILFRGTVSACTVHPREIVKRALQLNAAAMIFAHNHPSGVPTPSHADTALTECLCRALRPLDIRVLDHFVVAGSSAVSMAALGLL